MAEVRFPRVEIASCPLTFALTFASSPPPLVKDLTKNTSPLLPPPAAQSASLSLSFPRSSPLIDAPCPWLSL
ncbi:hypothetical protein DL93DRAFT_2079958, partial [Clavulina sp. PMI_390]